ncbi:MAG: 2-oxoacid:acceptor oxidoreductase family protein [Clostridia bacterium]
MEKQFLIAGFGGQGVLLIGQLIAKTAMRQGHEVSWMPSYGPEMRGGEANCAVVVSDEPIGSPLVSEPPVLVAMNKPSLVKFMPTMAKGGTLLYNVSLIEGVELRKDIKVIAVPCNEIMDKLGNSRVGNMAMLGAIQAATDVVTNENLIETLRDWLGEKKAGMLGINQQAIEEGRKVVLGE